MKRAREYNTNGNKKTKVLNTRVSEDEKTKLSQIGRKLNMNQSETIRYAIRNLIDNKDWIIENNN